MGRRHVGVAEHRVALQLLDHGLVFLGGLDGIHAEGDDLHAAQVGPLLGEHLVERFGDFQRVIGQCAVADAHLGDLAEGGLQRGQQLALELAVDLGAGVVALHVAADIGVEQHGIGDAIAVFAEAADGDVHVQADVLIHHAEGNCARRAVLVAGNLARVEEVDALILARLATEGEPVEGGLENLLHLFAGELAVEQAGLGVDVEHVLAGLGAEVHDLTLIHDQHALALIDHDDGAGGDDVVILGAAAAEALVGALHGLGDQHVVGHGVHVEVFLPLAGHRAAQRVQTC